jgi:predicted GIY-YIG superfamily endonuclease
MTVGCPTSLFLYSMSLIYNLKEYRQLKSAAGKIPIYCVFGDTVMNSIAQNRPLTQKALLDIRGLTEEKCKLYGADILSMVKKSRASEPSTAPEPPVVVVKHTRKRSLLEPWSRRRGVTKPFDMGKVNTATKRIPGIPAGREGVYILELTQGRVYVGHSSDMQRRIQQHMAGHGSAFTKAFPPTGVILPRLGCVTGSPEAAERDETLRYMFLRGIQLVRGWRYVRVEMPANEVDDAEENIRELFDLCRRCGHPGHFITHCKANFDRLGRPCKF